MLPTKDYFPQKSGEMFHIEELITQKWIARLGNASASTVRRAKRLRDFTKKESQADQ
jgi:hypothetical protein